MVSKAGERLIEAVREAKEVAAGRQEPAAIHYRPSTVDRHRARVQMHMEGEMIRDHEPPKPKREGETALHEKWEPATVTVRPFEPWSETFGFASDEHGLARMMGVAGDAEPRPGALRRLWRALRGRDG